MEMMNDNDELAPQVDEVAESERKMVELMAQMQKQASTIPDTATANTDGNIGLTIKPEENVNYWDIDDLPSKFKLYPDDVNIVARPLKVLEVKKLTALTDSNADKIVNDILRKTIRGIDVNEIYSADKMYLLLWLRANSFRDNRYVVDFACSCCEEESTYHFDIDNVEVDYLSDDYDPNKIIELSNGDKLKVKLLQIKDELELQAFNTKYRSIFEKTGEEVDDELLAISFMIDTVNGAKLDSVAMYSYLLDMSPQDFSSLTTALGGNNVGLRNYMNVKCDKCGGESQLGITFHPDFFLPRFKSE